MICGTHSWRQAEPTRDAAVGPADTYLFVLGDHAASPFLLRPGRFALAGHSS